MALACRCEGVGAATVAAHRQGRKIRGTARQPQSYDDANTNEGGENYMRPLCTDWGSFLGTPEAAYYHGLAPPPSTPRTSTERVAKGSYLTRASRQQLQQAGAMQMLLLGLLNLRRVQVAQVQQHINGTIQHKQHSGGAPPSAHKAKPNHPHSFSPNPAVGAPHRRDGMYVRPTQKRPHARIKPLPSASSASLFFDLTQLRTTLQTPPTPKQVTTQAKRAAPTQLPQTRHSRKRPRRSPKACGACVWAFCMDLETIICC